MVFVLSKQKKHLDMCSNAKARVLLKKGYAVVHKVFPFTIRLKKDVSIIKPKEYKIKIDPGSKYTGLSIIDNNANVVFLANIEHRGEKVVSNLITRQQSRRNRRQRETRYRSCKFINRKLKKDAKYRVATNRPEGWLPPSVISIEQNIINLLKKLKKVCNITSSSIEYVKFDTQLMENSKINGIQYQQGTLFGYEIREYLYHKYGHTCQYCGGATKDNHLEVEHMISKKNSGSNSIRNLSLACHTCNKDKDSLNLDQWLTNLKSLKTTNLNDTRIKRIEHILSKGTIYRTTRYSAWVNGYKEKLVKDTKKLIPDIELGTGGQTSHNRNVLKLSKQHYYDALCVGAIPSSFKFKTTDVLTIKAYGRGSHFRGRTNSCGIIISKLPRQKQFYGFQTGDIISATVIKGKKIGSYFGRVATRSSGYFNIQTKEATIQGINHKNCKIVQRNDGYSYNIEKRVI